MKSLAAWSSSRAGIRGTEERTTANDAEIGSEVEVLLSDIVDALSRSALEARSLMLHRQQSNSVRLWLKQQGMRLETAFSQNIASIRKHILGSVSASVLPLLQKHIEHKSAADFMAALDAHCRDTVSEHLRAVVPARLSALVGEELEKGALKWLRPMTMKVRSLSKVGKPD